MKLTPGNELHWQTRGEVLRAFIYRWTADNTRREAVWATIDGKPTIPLVSDTEWLATHAFWVNKDGSLSKNRRYAEPVWMVDTEAQS